MPDDSNVFTAEQNTLQQLDPDLYRRIKPHINEIVNEMNKQEISTNVFYAVIDELISSLEQSGNIPLEDEIAVPAISSVGSRQPFRPGPNRPPYHKGWRNPGGLSSDALIRLLLLRELGYFWF